MNVCEAHGTCLLRAMTSQTMSVIVHGEGGGGSAQISTLKLQHSLSVCVSQNSLRK